MSAIERLIQNNREWAARISAHDPAFFTSLSGQRKPRYLWIGCSDSRVLEQALNVAQTTIVQQAIAGL